MYGLLYIANNWNMLHDVKGQQWSGHGPQKSPASVLPGNNDGAELVRFQIDQKCFLKVVTEF